MGAVMEESNESTFRRPFNIPLESGLRSLFILAEVAPRFHDLQRLVYYDYLLVHSGDVPDGPQSLHPPVPHRSTEWLVRRKYVADGLDLMFSRELLEKRFEPTGITYGATELTRPFLNYLKSEYASSLVRVASWVAQTFGAYSDHELSRFMASNLGRWGAEFRREAVFRGPKL
jgi:hypothetical protein